MCSLFSTAIQFRKNVVDNIQCLHKLWKHKDIFDTSQHTITKFWVCTLDGSVLKLSIYRATWVEMITYYRKSPMK